MNKLFSKLLFDRQDYELLMMVQEVLSRETSRKSFKDLLNPYLNPHGIKEMAATQGFRIAYAMTNLLHSLEIGKSDDRLSALQSLHDEVLNITHSTLRRNTARVLLQIMKELVRVEGDYTRQLELAHDFRMAASGRPLFIRQELKRYHLLEMPEEWNQIAFDDHVHDANTKGRKTPTHLIMDAWIKGIRRLTVIYYNYVPPEAAAELLEAGEIMGIVIRIGVSVATELRGKIIRFVWVPRGFADARDFLSFLANPHVEAFMNEGRRISDCQRHYVLDVLREFNGRHRTSINNALGIELEPLEQADFLTFVAGGQASILHLAEFIHSRLLPLMTKRTTGLRVQYAASSDVEERRRIEDLVKRMRELDSEAIVEQYLRPAHNATIPPPRVIPHADSLPKPRQPNPEELLTKLDQLHTGYRICLNLSDLRVEDVLELLYDCRGMITHLEIYNLKDHVAGKTKHYREISDLQMALNKGNVIVLKRLIREIIQRMETSGLPDGTERIEKLTNILRNIPVLQAHYRDVPLKTYIGSDSTGRSLHHYGMGLVIRETLAHRAQKVLRHVQGPTSFVLPVRMTAYLRTTFIPYVTTGKIRNWLTYLLQIIPGLRHVGMRHMNDWEIQDDATHLASEGNIIPLGGLHEEGGNDLYLEEEKSRAGRGFSWRYINSSIKNVIKVLTGFIPAFLTFWLTKDWWFLAYGGAFIWFGITGLRNILQSALGGGGLRRSPLLHWNDYVSWGRLIDSLLFTGFSVPLLDYIVKTVLLDRMFGITTATNPVILYSVMAVANGLYLSSHNAFRGLPRGAIFGNLFRSILSIPIALTLNATIGGILYEADVEQIDDTLEKWAAIITKAASDCVAGIIEGLADRYENILMRRRDYAAKLRQLFDAYARLELLFPETDVLEMLESPKHFIKTINAEARDLERIVIINALDLLYLWMYQPRARSVLKVRVAAMSEEEKRIFVRSQYVLLRQREVSQIFLDGIIGRNFSGGLAFYLDRHEEYLRSLNKMIFRDATLRTAESEN